MSEQAIGFVESWVSETIRAEGNPADGDNSQAEAFAAQCLKAAEAEGIPQAEIDAAFDHIYGR